MASPSLSLPEFVPGIGHNRKPEPTTPIASVKEHLDSTYHDLVARFVDLEFGCARVPDPIERGDDAGLVTDFIAQCQVHVKQAEAAHKMEKATFLEGGRIVDKFFKRRCESLDEALVPLFSRLKAYRDRQVAERAERHHTLLTAAESEAARSTAYRAEAERLIEDPLWHDQAAHYRSLADATAESAAAMRREAEACLTPVRIQGDYGATAYVTHAWSFEVIDSEAVPRHYLSLNSEMVRTAITKDGIRDIPGLKIFQSENLRVRGVP